MGKFIFKPEMGYSGRFVAKSSGKIVKPTMVRDHLDTFLDATNYEVANNLSGQLMTGQISIGEFRNGVWSMTKSVHTAALALERGGFDNIKEKDRKFLKKQLEIQKKFLDGFEQALKSGKQKQDGTLIRRTQMYAESARETFYKSRRANAGEAGATHVSSRLSPADHCTECVKFDGVWYEIGDVKYKSPGTRICLTACKCYEMYSKKTEKGFEVFDDEFAEFTKAEKAKDALLKGPLPKDKVVEAPKAEEFITEYDSDGVLTHYKGQTIVEGQYFVPLGGKTYKNGKYTTIVDADGNYVKKKDWKKVPKDIAEAKKALKPKPSATKVGTKVVDGYEIPENWAVYTNKDGYTIFHDENGKYVKKKSLKKYVPKKTGAEEALSAQTKYDDKGNLVEWEGLPVYAGYLVPEGGKVYLNKGNPSFFDSEGKYVKKGNLIKLPDSVAFGKGPKGEQELPPKPKPKPKPKAPKAEITFNEDGTPKTYNGQEVINGLVVPKGAKIYYKEGQSPKVYLNNKYVKKSEMKKIPPSVLEIAKEKAIKAGIIKPKLPPKPKGPPKASEWVGTDDLWGDVVPNNPDHVVAVSDNDQQKTLYIKVSDLDDFMKSTNGEIIAAYDGKGNSWIESDWKAKKEPSVAKTSEKVSKYVGVESDDGDLVPNDPEHIVMVYSDSTKTKYNLVKVKDLDEFFSENANSNIMHTKKVNGENYDLTSGVWGAVVYKPKKESVGVMVDEHLSLDEKLVKVQMSLEDLDKPHIATYDGKQVFGDKYILEHHMGYNKETGKIYDLNTGKGVDKKTLNIIPSQLTNWNKKSLVDDVYFSKQAAIKSGYKVANFDVHENDYMPSYAKDIGSQIEDHVIQGGDPENFKPKEVESLSDLANKAGVTVAEYKKSKEYLSTDHYIASEKEKKPPSPTEVVAIKHEGNWFTYKIGSLETDGNYIAPEGGYVTKDASGKSTFFDVNGKPVEKWGLELFPTKAKYNLSNATPEQPFKILVPDSATHSITGEVFELTSGVNKYGEVTINSVADKLVHKNKFIVPEGGYIENDVIKMNNGSIPPKAKDLDYLNYSPDGTVEYVKKQLDVDYQEVAGFAVHTIEGQTKIVKGKIVPIDYLVDGVSGEPFILDEDFNEVDLDSLPDATETQKSIIKAHDIKTGILSEPVKPVVTATPSEPVKPVVKATPSVKNGVTIHYTDDGKTIAQGYIVPLNVTPKIDSKGNVSFYKDGKYYAKKNLEKAPQEYKDAIVASGTPSHKKSKKGASAVGEGTGVKGSEIKTTYTYGVDGTPYIAFHDGQQIISNEYILPKGYTAHFVGGGKVDVKDKNNQSVNLESLPKIDPSVTAHAKAKPKVKFSNGVISKYANQTVLEGKYLVPEGYEVTGSSYSGYKVYDWGGSLVTKNKLKKIPSKVYQEANLPDLTKPVPKGKPGGLQPTVTPGAENYNWMEGHGAHEWHQKNSELTKDLIERDSINTYTGSAYQSINDQLRNIGPTGGFQDRMIKGIESGIRNSVIKKDTTVWRGTKGWLDKDSVESLIGTVQSDKAFMSTTVACGENSPAYSFMGSGMMYEIRVPKGTRAAYAKTISRIQGEEEMILQRGSKFLVLGVEPHLYNGFATKKVVMQLLPED